jgi:tRNA-dihydrouridine synthase A
MTQEKRLISLAPMMDVSDRHFRYFTRLLSARIFNYTEMISCDALLNGPRERLLEFDTSEHPIAVQLGGSDPNKLSECSKMCEQVGYDEINLNVGCPSDRVQDGNIGVCLMLDPKKVAECVKAMIKAVNTPVTVKTRIGVDDNDDYEFLKTFIQYQVDVGCNMFIIHARKAWLKGLSPKQNRTIPELNYERVYQLVQDFPNCVFELNGGIRSYDDIQSAIDNVGSAMVGRALWDDPWKFHAIDEKFHGEKNPSHSRSELLEKYIPYMQKNIEREISINPLIQPLMGLFHQVKGSKKWRQFISENRKLDDQLLDKMFELCQQLENEC